MSMMLSTVVAVGRANGPACELAPSDRHLRASVLYRRAVMHGRKPVQLPRCWSGTVAPSGDVSPNRIARSQPTPIMPMNLSSGPAAEERNMSIALLPHGDESVGPD